MLTRSSSHAQGKRKREKRDGGVKKEERKTWI
jgi:hypothetical protein